MWTFSFRECKRRRSGPSQRVANRSIHQMIEYTFPQIYEDAFAHICEDANVCMVVAWGE